MSESVQGSNRRMQHLSEGDGGMGGGGGVESSTAGPSICSPNGAQILTWTNQHAVPTDREIVQQQDTSAFRSNVSSWSPCTGGGRGRHAADRDLTGSTRTAGRVRPAAPEPQLKTHNKRLRRTQIVGEPQTLTSQLKVSFGPRVGNRSHVIKASFVYMLYLGKEQIFRPCGRARGPDRTGPCASPGG